MIFDGALGRAGDEDQTARARGQCLFHRILNEWFVDDGQHLFGAGLGSWEEAGSSTCNGEYGDIDTALLYYGHKGSGPIWGPKPYHAAKRGSARGRPRDARVCSNSHPS